MTGRLVRWVSQHPSRGWIDASQWALAAAATLLLIDTAGLFRAIVAGEIVAVPRFEGLSVDAGTALISLGLWAIGLAMFPVRRLRRKLGWVLPAGVGIAVLLERQVFSDIAYLLVVVSMMHWWSSRLEARPSTSPVSSAPLRVVQAQVSIVFLWTAIAKLNPRFLSGAVLSVSFVGPIEVPAAILDRRVLVTLAVMTVFVEAVLAVALWMRRLRRVAVLAALLFHIGILAFFGPTLALASFMLVMGSGYAMFVAEPWNRPLVRTGVEASGERSRSNKHPDRE